MRNKPKILVILGPTATGKSDLAVKIAKQYNGEVISADSRQVYQGLDIGTGKITKKEMLGIPHHLLDVASPKIKFNAVDWKKLADKTIDDILTRGKLPIICGGTGFYIQSIVEGIVLPEVPPDKNLRKELETKSVDELVLMLKKLDRERIKNIDVKNKVRLVRAIEIATALGSVPNLKKVKPQFGFLQIGLKTTDDEAKKRISLRLSSRIKKGIIKEAEELHKKGLSWKRMRELGLEYKLLADLLENKITKSDFIKNLETEIWRYSKRQMTWFKRDKSIRWLLKKEDAITHINNWLT